METTPTNNQIINLLSEYCRITSVEETDRYMFSFESGRLNGTNLYLYKTSLDKIVSDLSMLNVYGETALYNDLNYEIIVKEESSLPIRRLRDDKIEVANHEAELRYELSGASDVYLVWLLNEMHQKLSLRDFRMNYINGYNLQRKLEDEKEFNILDYVRFTSFRFMTLKIYSDKKTSVYQFSRHTHSFLFHIGYNLDAAIVPQRLLEEIARKSRISRMRRSRIEDLDPPRRTYNEDLVQHYLLAVSTDNPVIEFLSYYHILEHFFETVFNEDLSNSVKTIITSPSFSYKRKKDIDQLVNIIKNSLKIKSESITFSESEALKLCISKFVNQADLLEKLNEYDGTLVDFYKNNKVEFSNGVEVDLKSSDVNAMYKSLSKRIYLTRCALVHSKDGEKSKYTPFKDDRTLVKEVPLMRFISEMVILSESDTL